MGKIIINVVCNLLSRILGEEVAAWTPKICAAVIHRAGLCLPKNERERFTEEWQSHTDEVPGSIGKLLAAGGFFLAACRISLDISQNDVKSWSTTLGQLRGTTAQLMEVVRCLRTDQRSENLRNNELIDQLNVRLLAMKKHTKRLGRLVSVMSFAPAAIVIQVLYPAQIWQLREKFEDISPAIEDLARLGADAERIMYDRAHY